VLASNNHHGLPSLVLENGVRLPGSLVIGVLREPGGLLRNRNAARRATRGVAAYSVSLLEAPGDSRRTKRIAR
jgi:hypothetical protein